MTLHVVAGVIKNTQGDILLARRPPQVHQGNLWEFPGGKRHVNESVEQALTRELYEELEITVQRSHPLMRIHHQYPDRVVLLDVWQVEAWQGQPWGREHQPVQWCAPETLTHYAFPAANKPIIAAARLPTLYLITPEPHSWQDKDFFYHLESSLAQGITLVQLRAKQLSEQAYCRCAEQVLKYCARYNAQLLVNATPEIALSVGAQGVHLTRLQLGSYARRPLPAHLWVAASCHTLTEIQQATYIGVDFIVLSTVRHTLSHPEAQPLGWLTFFQLTKQCPYPVFALGGLHKKDLPLAWAHGAQGVAGIRGLWG